MLPQWDGISEISSNFDSPSVNQNQSNDSSGYRVVEIGSTGMFMMEMWNEPTTPSYGFFHPNVNNSEDILQMNFHSTATMDLPTPTPSTIINPRAEESLIVWVDDSQQSNSSNLGNDDHQSFEFRNKRSLP